MASRLTAETAALRATGENQSMRVVFNPQATRAAYTARETATVSVEAAIAARDRIRAWPDYAPTPLLRLTDLAQELGLTEIYYKDESSRFGQGSFKVLGGAYAAELRLSEAGASQDVTLCCATDGNHGRAVAFAARKHGCRCLVYMHEHAPKDKAAAITALGAQIVRTPGTYDDSVRMAALAAGAHGYLLIPDTSTNPDDPTARLVMQGYGVMVMEFAEQLRDLPPPTHIFLQGGVGGLAAGVAGVVAQMHQRRRPRMIVIEPEAAACLLESATRLKPARVDGDLDTAMAMLATGEASSVAWPVLERRIDAFMAIGDTAAIAMAKRLRRAESGRPAIDVGISGAAGLAGLAAASRCAPLASALRLRNARVLVIGTEGAVQQAAQERPRHGA